MKEENGYFSSFDETKLFYRAWRSGSPHALMLVHGFGEHSGRYSELVEALSDLPLSIFIHDLRGHGRSEGPRVYVQAFGDFVEDLYRFRSFIISEDGLLRDFVLLGQSMGGLIAAHAALKNEALWKAIILLSPYFAVPRFDGLLGRASQIFNLIVPRVIWDNPFKPSFLTHDEAEISRYKQDPMIQRKITMRLAFEMFRACREALAGARRITIPVFALAAGDDRIVSLEASEKFLNRASSQDKKLEIFDGFYHELIHETGRAKPIAALKQYLIHLGL